MKILSAQSIFYSVTEKRDVKNILQNISFDVEEQSIFGISGESGSGKTTLAKILAGYLAPTKGKIVSNLVPRNTANPVQMLFQNTGNILNPYRKTFEMVSEAARVHNKDKQKAAKEAERILNLLNVGPELWNNRGYELSGGEQQRIALARLLAVNPQVLILDEPFAAQDIESQLNILNLLKDIKKEFELSIVCISHNLKILRNLSAEMITLKNGYIVVNRNKIPDSYEN